MEYGSIEREFFVAAPPEIVYEVISRPEHVREWWPDDAHLDPEPGGRGELVWHGAEPGLDVTMALQVVDAEPPHRFAFRWTHAADEVPDRSNSMLVTFDLTASGDGTTVRFVETGFRERGWEIAQLEAAYQDHVEGWNTFLPRLVAYGARRASVA